MRDFYPDEMELRGAIFDAWTAAAEAFGFRQYDACVVESLDLLKRKSGEEIVDQIYAFTDKSGRELALRPEMTPTLARMIAARQGEFALPLKWFAIAQCFRYERMTRGRKREHYQWNLDIVGDPGAGAEAEVLATAASALERMGLDRSDYRIHFNSRALVAELLRHADIPADSHGAVFLALDKRDKRDDVDAILADSGLDDASVSRVMQFMDLSTLDDVESVVGSDSAALQTLRELVTLLAVYELDAMVRFDISIIRGLDYYTGTVFEAYDSSRSLRAIFGGGRYDDLLGHVGGKPAAGVGLGFGDVVIAELLTERGVSTPHADGGVAIGFMQGGQRETAMRLAKKLRADGRCVDLALQSEKARVFFSRAGKRGYREAIYIGPDDVASGSVRVKDLAKRTEREVSLES